jgi:polysaccharide biosynthesis protein VpsM
MKSKSPQVSAAMAAVVLLLAFSSALAQEEEASADDFDVVGGRFFPSLTATGFYTDNVFNQPDVDETTGRPVAQQDASGVVVTPLLRYLEEGRRVTVSAQVGADIVSLDVPGAADDYIDRHAAWDLTFNATTRNRFAAHLDARRGHDPFGTDRTESQDPAVRDAELDQWNLINGGVRYDFGTPGAKIGASLGASRQRKHYVTNEERTRPLDYESFTTEYALFYHYSPKTSGVIDFRRTDVEFDYPFGATDLRGGHLYQARLVARWLATAKTSGDVRVGYRMRTFESGARNSDGLDWQAGVSWSPRAVTHVRLSSGRTEQQSYRANTSVIEVDFLRLDWTQTLTSRLKAGLGYHVMKADFRIVEGATAPSREDTIHTGTVFGEFLAMRYLWITGNVSFTSRESSELNRDYDRLGAYLGVRLTR